MVLFVDFCWRLFFGFLLVFGFSPLSSGSLRLLIAWLICCSMSTSYCSTKLHSFSNVSSERFRNSSSTSFSSSTCWRCLLELWLLGFMTFFLRSLMGGLTLPPLADRATLWPFRALALVFGFGFVPYLFWSVSFLSLLLSSKIEFKPLFMSFSFSSIISLSNYSLSFKISSLISFNAPSSAAAVLASDCPVELSTVCPLTLSFFLSLAPLTFSTPSLTYSIWPSAGANYKCASYFWSFLYLISLNSTCWLEFYSRLKFLNSICLWAFSACIYSLKFLSRLLAISFISSIWNEDTSLI